MRYGSVGKIIPNGQILKEHEIRTIVFLASLGYEIELIPKSNIKGVHKADIIMFGLEWEIKSPQGKGKWLIKNTVQKASHQSENIIIDLCRIKIPLEKSISELERQFQYSKRIKRMIIVTKSKKLLEYNK